MVDEILKIKLVQIHDVDNDGTKDHVAVQFETPTVQDLLKSAVELAALISGNPLAVAVGAPFLASGNLHVFAKLALSSGREIADLSEAAANNGTVFKIGDKVAFRAGNPCSYTIVNFSPTFIFQGGRVIIKANVVADDGTQEVVSLDRLSKLSDH